MNIEFQPSADFTWLGSLSPLRCANYKTSICKDARKRVLCTDPGQKTFHTWRTPSQVLCQERLSRYLGMVTHKDPPKRSCAAPAKISFQPILWRMLTDPRVLSVILYTDLPRHPNNRPYRQTQYFSQRNLARIWSFFQTASVSSVRARPSVESLCCHVRKFCRNKPAFAVATCLAVVFKSFLTTAWGHLPEQFTGECHEREGQTDKHINKHDGQTNKQVNC